MSNQILIIAGGVLYVAVALLRSQTEKRNKSKVGKNYSKTHPAFNLKTRYILCSGFLTREF
jgi:hypothetical protein